MSNAAKSLQFGQTTLKLKVTRVRKYKEFIYTVGICPAEDEYTKPSTVQIRSKSRFASTDEEITVNCKIGGYQKRPYTITDKSTGEEINLIPVEHTLDLIE